MAKLTWDDVTKRLYETGVDRGVIYPRTAQGTYTGGEAWNGLTAVTQSPSGAEPNPFYADNIKYLNIMSVEEFGFTIEAYMYPDAFRPCNGEASLGEGVTLGQQGRAIFGFSYRTIIGNDTEFNDHGYKLHLVYGAQAAPSEVAYATVNDTPEPIGMSWECTTTPVPCEGFKPVAHIEIDSTKVDPDVLAAIEAKLYGDTDSEPTLPLPSELQTMLTA